MWRQYEPNELVALELQDADAVRACVTIYVREKPNEYIATPGRNCVIVPRLWQGWLTDQVASHGYSVTQVYPVSYPYDDGGLGTAD